MAGWSFTITRQPAEEYPGGLNHDAILASWTVGAGGIRWIDRLVEQGEAKSVRRGGYPNLYTAPARVIASLLAGGEPPSGNMGAMFGPREVNIRQDELDRCTPDQALTIAVWDQS